MKSPIFCREWWTACHSSSLAADCPSLPQPVSRTMRAALWRRGREEEGERENMTTRNNY